MNFSEYLKRHYTEQEIKAMSRTGLLFRRREFDKMKTREQQLSWETENITYHEPGTVPYLHNYK